jgi:hypothetical protein
MTTQLKQDGFGTPFGVWLRKQPEIDSRQFNLSIQNLDYIIHRYQGLPYQAIMLVEEKRYMGSVSFAQRDTHGLLDQALRIANSQYVVNARNKRVQLRYFGYFVLQFENETPDDGKIYWQHKEISRGDLLKLLKFEHESQKRIIAVPPTFPVRLVSGGSNDSL